MTLVALTKTRAVFNPNGERKAPLPSELTGWVRIDIVHQDDVDGLKIHVAIQHPCKFIHRFP